MRVGKFKVVVRDFQNVKLFFFVVFFLLLSLSPTLT